MMRVSLMNLGDGPRVFHNRLGRSVVVPVGAIVDTDLSESVIQGLRHSTRPETVLVVDEDHPEPDGVDGLLVVLNSMQTDDYETLLQQFAKISPPSNLTKMRMSREQIGVVLRTMAEDIVLAHRDGKKVVHDDVDPAELEEEVRRQEDKDKWREPQHPLQKEQERKAAENSVPHAGLAPEPAERPPARTRPAPSRAKRAGRR